MSKSVHIDSIRSILTSPKAVSPAGPLIGGFLGFASTKLITDKSNGQRFGPNFTPIIGALIGGLLGHLVTNYSTPDEFYDFSNMTINRKKSIIQYLVKKSKVK